MKVKTKQFDVFLVDDESGIRKVVRDELEEMGCRVKTFSSAADCLKDLPRQNCNLLITDVKMPGMDGLALLEKAKRLAPWVPVLVVSGYGNVPMAVQALKLGAADFIEKPLQREAFLHRVELILRENDFSDMPIAQKLTKIEKRVLRMILDGKANKEMAYMLERATRTVERHRSDIMRKFDVDNIVDLVKKASLINLNGEG